MKPWLSVLIPVYNGDKYLLEMLTSIVAIHDEGIECVIVDDESTDSSVNIIKSFNDELNIVFLPQTHTGNWAANANRALFAARGKFVCHLHQDDKWLSNRINVIQKLIDRPSDCSLYLTAAQFIDNAGKSLGTWRCPLPSFPSVVDGEAVCRALLIQDFISIPAPVFKRKDAIDIGGLDETLWYTPDWDFWFKLASMGSVVYDPTPTVAFRIHKGSQTIMGSRNIENFRMQLHTVFERNLTNISYDGDLGKVIKVGRFSIKLNTALASIAHGSKPELFEIFWRFSLLGPKGWWLYMKYSRILERLGARILARIRKRL